MNNIDIFEKILFEQKMKKGRYLYHCGRPNE
jgi:hypothetical protein